MEGCVLSGVLWCAGDKKESMSEKNKMKQIYAILREHRWVLAVCLNLIILAVLLIFYQPIRNVDDYAIASDVYGSYLGEYNRAAIYMNPVYGAVMAGLLSLNGAIPWYSVLMYVWTFLALTLVTYCFTDMQDNWLGWGISIILSFSYGYECYVCMQWTKTSAIALGAGVFALLCKKRHKGVVVIALVEIFMGAFIRSANILMVLGVWVCTLLFELFLTLLEKKKDAIAQVCKKNILVICVGGATLLLTKYTGGIQEDYTGYAQWNANRANLQDYGMPDYREYRDIYESYDITQEEWNYIRAWGTDIYNAELYEKMVAVKKEVSELEAVDRQTGYGTILREFFVQYPKNFAQIDMFYCYLIVLIGVFFFMRYKYGWLASGYSFLLLLGMNFYLFFKGRYFIHRVDVGIIFNIILVLLYLWRKATLIRPSGKKFCVVMGVVVLLMMLTPTGLFSDDKDFVSKETLEQNNRFNRMAAKDSHFYVYANTNYHNMCRVASFDVFQVPEVGELKNTFGILLPTPKIQKNLKNQGITDPYVDLVDGTDMYFVSDRSEVDEWMIGYLAKRNGKPVKVTMVKKVLNKYIYRVNSGDINELYQFDDIKEDNTHLVNTTENTIKNGVLNIRGNLYMDNENDFYQNIYIRIKDSDTGETNLFYVCQNQDKEFKVGMPGWCSALDVAIPLPDTYDEKDEISFVIETEDGVYQCGVDIAH